MAARRPNAIAIALANYKREVENTFGEKKEVK